MDYMCWGCSWGVRGVLEWLINCFLKALGRNMAKLLGKAMRNGSNTLIHQLINEQVALYICEPMGGLERLVNCFLKPPEGACGNIQIWTSIKYFTAWKWSAGYKMSYQTILNMFMVSLPTWNASSTASWRCWWRYRIVKTGDICDQYLEVWQTGNSS